MDNNFTNAMMTALPFGFGMGPNNDIYARIGFSYQYKPWHDDIAGTKKSEVWHFGNGYLDISEEDKGLSLKVIKERVIHFIQTFTKVEDVKDIRHISINIMYNFPNNDDNFSGGIV